MNKFDEQIIVVNRETIFNHEKNHFNGFISIEDQKALEIYETLSKYEVKRRGDMEEDPSYKQLISYCILENENDEILVYERLTGGGEARLHGLSSIGIGGHMNQLDDTQIEGVLLDNAARELEEEVGVKDVNPLNLNLIGFINDDDNEVGRVHIGLVFKLKVKASEVYVNETDTLKIEWKPENTLMQGAEYESWSRIIIESIYNVGH
ncbi:NUDIX domain-containing protein [Macrococcoides bohemicum]|uniref:NUDIX domain-containing protein n=2 Tax=Macrococcoides TaxID=3076173 RepID=A0A328A6T5_9STAP|nr:MULTISPECIES: NUDIX domain-containing protein [Macrococcus]ATD30085.1 DNA mismatch repair protein MutT [Macrococcus sp. IME1552]QRN50217.1 NUDIX domain-containing protein [Macrococcus bohemicus]QYA41642.1 NUDIX domain-containing protein [Macrococcus bohemicus]QYA44066.1 NUDIX domain-containing protein [Macrococcus bohemicus]RAI82300.1 NUDIX domain-containing protein [Macrococcus goetzii]